jgi:microcystin-dependent protein
MTDQFVGEIRAVGFNFAPQGWAQCNGQLLPINQNQAIFSLLGTTYGGNGQTTFGLPDLRGRVPMSQGGGFPIGSRFGEYSHTLITSEMATHNHGMKAKAATANAPTPDPTQSVAQGRVAATGTPPTVSVFGTGAPNRVFAPTAITATGGSQPHDNTQPYLTLNVCIALQGIFPSQN